MSYKLTFSNEERGHIFVNSDPIASPYSLSDGDEITIISCGPGTKINNIAYSTTTTLALTNTNINVDYKQGTSSAELFSITINFTVKPLIVSTDMLTHFKDKLFEQRTWTFPHYIDFQMGNYESSGADVIVHFPTPLQSGHNEFNLAVEENTITMSPNKKQTVYAFNNTMMQFSYFDKETSQWSNQFTGISLLGDSIASTVFRGIIQFENEDGISQISNYDTDSGYYAFTFTQKEGANQYTIKFPARTNGIVMVQEEGKTFFTADNIASNGAIDLMFK